MKKTMVFNLCLAGILLYFGTVFAEPANNLDVTMELMEANENEPEMIINRIELPPKKMIRETERLRHRNGVGEGSEDQDQYRERTQHQAMEQAQEQTRERTQLQAQEHAQERAQQHAQDQAQQQAQDQAQQQAQDQRPDKHL